MKYFTRHSLAKGPNKTWWLRQTIPLPPLPHYRLEDREDVTLPAPPAPGPRCPARLSMHVWPCFCSAGSTLHPGHSAQPLPASFPSCLHVFLSHTRSKSNVTAPIRLDVVLRAGSSTHLGKALIKHVLGGLVLAPCLLGETGFAAASLSAAFPPGSPSPAPTAVSAGGLSSSCPGRSQK